MQLIRRVFSTSTAAHKFLDAPGRANLVPCTARERRRYNGEYRQARATKQGAKGAGQGVKELMSRSTRIGRAWLFLICTLVGWSSLAGVWSLSLNDRSMSMLKASPIQESNVAHAQDGVSSSSDDSGGKNVLGHIIDAGWVGGVIIVCSIVGFSLAILVAENLVSIYKELGNKDRASQWQARL